MTCKSYGVTVSRPPKTRHDYSNLTGAAEAGHDNARNEAATFAVYVYL